MMTHERITWVDFVKTVAIFSVVLLHSAAPVAGEYGKMNLNSWQFANVYDSMVRMAVPLFFMLTGTLLLNAKDEPLTLFLKKRFTKVAIPLLVWSLIYILFRKYVLDEDISILKLFFSSFVWKVYYHLWFLYTLIGLYLFVPILKVFVQHASRSLQIYYVVLWGIAVSVLPVFNKFSGYTLPNYMPMIAGYAGYLVLGHLLSKVMLTRQIVYLSLGAMIISTSVTAVCTFLLSEAAGEFDGFFYGYFSLSTIMQAVSSFVVLRYLGETVTAKSAKVTAVMVGMGSASLGIYLVHPMVLWSLDDCFLHSYDLIGTFAPLSVPVTAVTAFAFSYAIVFAMRKIPVVRRIVP